MAEYRTWPATNGTTDVFNDGQPITQGTEFKVTSVAWATKLWYWRAAVGMGDSVTVLGQIYRIDGAGIGAPLLAAPVSFPVPTALGWQSVDIEPVQLIVNQHYKTVVYYPDGNYTAVPGNNYWANGGPGSSGITNGPLVAVAAVDATEGQATFHLGSGIQYPNLSFNSGNYWIDVTVTDTIPPRTARKNAAFMSFIG